MDRSTQPRPVTGNRQRLGLACALVHRPRVLILDEPTTATIGPTQLLLALPVSTAGIWATTAWWNRAQLT